MYPSDGNLQDDREIYTWAMEIVETQAIAPVGNATLAKLVGNLDDLVVVFYDSAKKRHTQGQDSIGNTCKITQVLCCLLKRNCENWLRYNC